MTTTIEKPESVAGRPADPFAVDFASRDITGVVRSVREFGDSGFVVVGLDGSRAATGEIGDDDADLSPGVAYRFFGAWTHHEKHGDQFRFTAFAVAARQAQMGVVAYLTRKPFTLTKANVMRAWATFGGDTLDAIRDRPGDVITACEFPEAAAAKIKEASALLKDSGAGEAVKIELHELFAGRGFPGKAVKACVTTWGQRAPAVIRRNPFALIVKDIPGVGFRRADKLYLDLGGNPLRLKRQTLAAWESLRASGSGNTWESENVVYAAILKAAGSVDAGKFAKAIALGLRARWLAQRVEGDFAAAIWGASPAGSSAAPVALDRWYAEKSKAASEARLVKHVRRVLGHAAIWPAVTVDDLADDHQRGHVAAIAGSALAILGGTPGTGKTFTAAVLIRCLLRQLPAGRIAVCAPTGKAAVRITEAMARYGLPLQANTVHQKLEVDGSTRGGDFKFLRNESRPLDAQVVVIDEGSMLDTDLAASLFAALPAGCNVLVVGDPYQLPPVGHGAPLRDLIAARVPTALLTEIKRNDGAIVRACAAIKDGRRFEVSPRVDPDAGHNLVHFPADSTAEQVQGVVGLLGRCHAKGFNPIWDCQVVVATNDKSEVSRKQMNRVLQDVLNPVQDWMLADRKNPLFRPGDKVICLKNTEVSRWEDRTRIGEIDGGEDAAAMEDTTDPTNYVKTQGMCYVANGDMGRVLATDAKGAVVRFLQPDRVVRVDTSRKKPAGGPAGGSNGDGDNGDGGNKLDFDLAYAVTVHKSQGSEWPIVVVVLDEGSGPIGSREWIYTAISRASKLCFLVGKLATAYKFASRINLEKRKTFLSALLTERALLTEGQ